MRSICLDGRDPPARRGARPVVPQHRPERRADRARPFPRRLPGGEMAELRRCDPAGSRRQDRARHRLQRRLLLDRDEAARRRARARHRLRRRLSRPGALRGRGRRARHRVPQALGLRRRRARRALRRRALHGRALPPAPSAAGARPDPRACREGPVRLPVDAARLARGRARRRRTTRSGRPSISTGPATRSCISSSTAMPTIRPTGGCRTAPASRRCCAAPVSRSSQHPEDEVYVCRRVEPPPYGAGAVYPARGRQAHDRSGDDLERAEQQVALGPGARSGLDASSPRWRSLAGQAIAAENPDLPRVLGGMSPIDPGFVAQHGSAGRARPHRRRRGARLPARLEPVADRRMAGEARRDPRRHRPADLGHARSASRPSAPRRCRNGGCSAPPSC